MSKMSVMLLRCVATLSGLVPWAASASQGPGVAAGTASPWLQFAMAFTVYGAAALMIAAGLVGAVRQAR